MTVSIRYFEAQGRAQAIRHALADAGQAFEDVRVSREDWPKHKGDPSFSGWFGSLPTLTWDDDTISEALPIASYVARRLGHYEGLAPRDIARVEAVVSAIYLDVQLPFAQLCYAELLYPGANISGAAAMTIGRALDKLGRIGAMLAPSGWLSGDRPTIGDFYFAEGTELILRLTSEEILRAKTPRALDHAARVRARPPIAREWQRRPPTFTANPGEPAIVERIRSVPLA